jgi:hypothetical protein
MASWAGLPLAFLSILSITWVFAHSNPQGKVTQLIPGAEVMPLSMGMEVELLYPMITWKDGRNRFSIAETKKSVNYPFLSLTTDLGDNVYCLEMVGGELGLYNLPALNGYQVAMSSFYSVLQDMCRARKSGLPLGAGADLKIDDVLESYNLRLKENVEKESLANSVDVANWEMKKTKTFLSQRNHETVVVTCPTARKFDAIKRMFPKYFKDSSYQVATTPWQVTFGLLVTETLPFLTKHFTEDYPDHYIPDVYKMFKLAKGMVDNSTPRGKELASHFTNEEDFQHAQLPLFMWAWRSITNW